jgi:hypothetical protein
LRRHQTHIVAERRQPGGRCDARQRTPPCRSGSGNISKSALNLTSGYFLPHNHGTPPVEADHVKRVLAEVDPDRGDGSRHPLTMRCTHRMLLLELRFTPPKVQQIRALSTAGPSHYGEAILPIFIGRGAPANFLKCNRFRSGLRVAPDQNFRLVWGLVWGNFLRTRDLFSNCLRGSRPPPSLNARSATKLAYCIIPNGTRSGGTAIAHNVHSGPRPRCKRNRQRDVAVCANLSGFDLRLSPRAIMDIRSLLSSITRRPQNGPWRRTRLYSGPAKLSGVTGSGKTRVFRQQRLRSPRTPMPR